MLKNRFYAHFDIFHYDFTPSSQAVTKYLSAHAPKLFSDSCNSLASLRSGAERQTLQKSNLGANCIKIYYSTQVESIKIVNTSKNIWKSFMRYWEYINISIQVLKIVLRLDGGFTPERPEGVNFLD